MWLDGRNDANWVPPPKKETEYENLRNVEQNMEKEKLK